MNIISFADLSDSKVLIDFLITLSSVFITAVIGWVVYLKQQKIQRIKDDIEKYLLIFNDIKHNIEYSSAFLDKANSSICDIDSYIANINLLKNYYDCYYNKKDLEITIEFPNLKAKKDYIKSKIQAISKTLILQECYIKIIGSLNENDYSKDVLFLASWGDVLFQQIYINLLSECKRINQIVNYINKIIDMKSGSDFKYINEVSLIDEETNDYDTPISGEIQQLLYFKDLYKQLKISSERSIFYADLALNHLINFNKAYSTKFKKRLLSLDIVCPIFDITKNYNLKSMEYYLENISLYEELNVLPQFKLLQTKPNNFFKFK